MYGQNNGGAVPFSGPEQWQLGRRFDARSPDGGSGFSGGAGLGPMLGGGATPPMQAPQLPPALAAYFAQVNRSNNQSPIGGGHAGLPFDPFMQMGTGGGLPPQGGGMGIGGGLPPQSLPPMGLGGGMPPQGMPPQFGGGGPQMGMGGGMQPRPMPQMQRGGPTRRNLGFGAMR